MRVQENVARAHAGADVQAFFCDAGYQGDVQ